LNPDYAIGIQVSKVTGNAKRAVLFHSPRNHSLRFMVSDNFRRQDMGRTSKYKSIDIPKLIDF